MFHRPGNSPLRGLRRRFLTGSRGNTQSGEAGGLEYDSPGQGPGWEMVPDDEALKGRHTPASRRKAITPFQSWVFVVGPLLRVL